jgi:hypothetical protein
MEVEITAEARSSAPTQTGTTEAIANDMIATIAITEIAVMEAMEIVRISSVSRCLTN